jgi:hypothetical protein
MRLMKCLKEVTSTARAGTKQQSRVGEGMKRESYPLIGHFISADPIIPEALGI